MIEASLKTCARINASVNHTLFAATATAAPATNSKFKFTHWSWPAVDKFIPNNTTGDRFIAFWWIFIDFRYFICWFYAAISTSWSCFTRPIEFRKRSFAGVLFEGRVSDTDLLDRLYTANCTSHYNVPSLAIAPISFSVRRVLALIDKNIDCMKFIIWKQLDINYSTAPSLSHSGVTCGGRALRSIWLSFSLLCFRHFTSI